MPKQSKHPRPRVSIKRGKSGQVWRSWFYDNRGTGRPDVALGNDYQVALAKWAELSTGGLRITGTLEEAFARWEVEMLPSIKEATRKDYARCLARLRPVFGPAIWSTVRLPTLKAYLKARSGKTRANRELSVLNLIWNWERLEDMTELKIPSAMVRVRVSPEAPSMKSTTYSASQRGTDRPCAPVAGALPHRSHGGLTK